MSYRSDLLTGLSPEAGVYTGHILKGREAGPSSVQRATRVEPIVNLKSF